MFCCGWVAVAAAQVEAPPLLVRNVTVIDGNGKTQANVSVSVRGGMIAAIGAELQPEERAIVIDGAGKFLMPGIIDTRVQLSASPGNKTTRAEVGQEQRIAWIHAMLKLGVTGARLVQGDLAEQRDLQRWRQRALLNGPSLFASGPTFTAPEGIPAEQYSIFAMATRDRELFEVKDEDQAREKSRVVAHNGGEVFEVVYSAGPPQSGTPRLADDALVTIIKEAHGHDLKVFCWVGTDAEAAKAVADGCDAVEGATEERLSPATLKQMAAKNVAFVPSLLSQGYAMAHLLAPDAMQAYLARPEVEASLTPLMKRSLAAPRGQLTDVRDVLDLSVNATQEELAAARQGKAPAPVPQDDGAAKPLTIRRSLEQQEERAAANLKAAKAAGVRIVLGSGAGGALALPGPAAHLEMELLAQQGLTPLEAIQAATRNAAMSLGKEGEVGTIEVGKRADFILLDASPLADIRNTTRISGVVRDGWVIDRENMDRY